MNVEFLVRLKKAATKTFNITLGVWIRWQSYLKLSHKVTSLMLQGLEGSYGVVCSSSVNNFER